MKLSSILLNIVNAGLFGELYESRDRVVATPARSKLVATLFFNSSGFNWSATFYDLRHIKGIVHFEIKIWYLSAYPKGIQDVGVFFSSVDPILIFLGQTVLVCQSYNGRYRSLSL